MTAHSSHSAQSARPARPVDHRRLGRELDLFDSDPLIGAGLPYWLPDGAAVRHTLEEYIREAERRAGYQHVYSPVLAKRELYEISGHWSHYRDDMYPPMRLGGGQAAAGDSEADADAGADAGAGASAEELVLRPSLCPHHALIFRSRSRSHRELPLRMAELGGMYRAELSGVLGGLTRVRAIQLNDAHVFCTLEQVADEARAALDLIRAAYADLGIRATRYRLSLASAAASEPAAAGAEAGGEAGGEAGKYVADPAMWRRAADLLTEVLDRAGLPYEAEEGEAAFYGPKIDVQVTDPAGRETTLSTVQVDFHQPARFGLAYVGPDGARHRPVMVHRSVIGSVERAVAHLVETHAGAFPAWLAPTQLVALPVTDDELPHAARLVERCVSLGLRARLAGPEEGTLGARIRAERLVPYHAVIGHREAAAGADLVALRLRDGRRLPARPAGGVLDRVGRLVASRSAELWDA
ncbi:aminoacyl--tRNA ligase-related protein [Streptomyces sp. 4N509B]|uniref:aminoacyl--tRNA ligase-related protein n=1 Tax=Streptomyces sp. 4N509B TaxID=3457413 RepID=UPI003FD5C953